MRKLVLTLFVLVAVAVAGCVPSTGVLVKDIGAPRVRQKGTAGVGDVFFHRTTYEYKIGSIVGKRILSKPKPLMYTLRVLEVAEKSIVLEYKEYRYSKSPFGDKWRLKPELTNTHHFRVRKKPLWFKGVKFEIISIKDGIIHYKRIK